MQWLSSINAPARFSLNQVSFKSLPPKSERMPSGATKNIPDGMIDLLVPKVLLKIKQAYLSIKVSKNIHLLL